MCHNEETPSVTEERKLNFNIFIILILQSYQVKMILMKTETLSYQSGHSSVNQTSKSRVSTNTYVNLDCHVS